MSWHMGKLGGSQYLEIGSPANFRIGAFASDVGNLLSLQVELAVHGIYQHLHRSEEGVEKTWNKRMMADGVESRCFRPAAIGNRE